MNQQTFGGMEDSLEDKFKKIPNKDFHPILVEMRKKIGKSEDEWESGEELAARDVLCEHYPEMEGLDPSKITPKATGCRKDSSLRARESHEELRTAKERLQSAGKRLEDYEHSPEYLQRIASPDWAALRAEHFERCNYRCQGCGCFAHGKLELHHTAEGYRHLGSEKPWHLMALCLDCHLVMDGLRKEGSFKQWRLN